MLTNVPQAAEYNNQRILTTKQIAEFYGTDHRLVSNNFARNKSKYKLGKHYYCLEGEDLKAFKSSHQNDDSLKGVNRLYLWTEKGALLHAKSLNTDKAWEIYEFLVDEYYRRPTITQQPVQVPFLNTLWTKRALIFNEKTLIPDGYWCIFNEIGHICWQMELKDVHLTEESTPDISVGQLWAKHARSLGRDMSQALKYDHHYPPGDKRGIQQAYIYPNAWYGDFRDWFQIQYLKVGFKKYLATHMIVNGEMPAPKRGQIEGK